MILKNLSSTCRPQRLATRSSVGGFTLMELLVVILIIGLLTGIIGPRLLGQVSKLLTRRCSPIEWMSGTFPRAAKGWRRW